MSEEITKKLDEDGSELPFEEFVRRQFRTLNNRINALELILADLRNTDKKVDVFVKEHLYLKREVQHLQEPLEKRH